MAKLNYERHALAALDALLAGGLQITKLARKAQQLERWDIRACGALAALAHPVAEYR